MKNISRNVTMLILAVIMCIGLGSVSAFAAEEEPDAPEEHIHILQEFPAEPAGCGTDGHIEYWQCEICEKYFSDPEGINEISLSDTVIPATGQHSWDGGVVTLEPTYDSNGVKIYTCTVCGATRTESVPALVRGTGFYESDGNWYYYKDGEIDRSVSSVLNGTVNGTDGWWYVVGGKVDFSYTGVAGYANDFGWWYISGGQVDFSKNSVEQNTYGWWYVVGGQVDFSYTGVADYANDYGWWYIAGGKVDFGRTGIDPNDYGWWRVVNGKVDFSCNSVEQNDYGWWYLTGGQVRFDYTGVADYANAYGWWYVRNGQVDFSKNSVEQNAYAWWYVLGGKVNFSYTGVANYANDYGWWYINAGRVDFSRNSVEQNDYGWWYVTGGGVRFDYTGVADYDNAYGWWYVKNGKVDFSFTGGAENRYGMWYVRNGQVDFGTNGTVTRLGVRYTVSNGKVTSYRELTQAEKLAAIQAGKGTIYSSSLVYLANNSPEAIDFVYLYPELYPIHYTEDYDLTAEAMQDTVPLLMQWDMRWGYVPYDDSCLGLAGCGILSLSMVALYLLDDPSMTPTFLASYAMENGYYEPGVGTSRTLYDYGCAALGLNSEFMTASEAAMKDALDRGCLIIATMGPGIFTTGGHVIVFTGYNDQGFTVNDPNSYSRSATVYSFDQFGDQVKFMWAISAA